MGSRLAVAWRARNSDPKLRYRGGVHLRLGSGSLS